MSSLKSPTIDGGSSFMADKKKNPDHRYVNDLRRIDYAQSVSQRLRNQIVPIGLSVVFLSIIALFQI